MPRFITFIIFSVMITVVSSAAMRPLGNPKAPQGGTITLELKSEPGTLNPFSYTDYYAMIIHSYVLEGLLTRNIDTYEWEPNIAKSWNESKDGKKITFVIREGIKFHDGKPLTVEDIKFSFDAIRDPAFKAARFMPYYENIKEAKIIDKSTIEFIIKTKYFNNLNVLAALTIVPKHVYKDPKKRTNKILVGTGGYTLHKYNRGRNIILKKNKNYWGKDEPSNKGVANFKFVKFKFLTDDNVKLEHLKKGSIDFVEVITPEEYIKKAVGKPWGDKAFTVKVKNLKPKEYRYVSWNFKKDLFKSRDVRMALTKLMDRRTMIKKFRYDLELPATGPWYQQSPYASKTIKSVEFDVKGARALLKKDGWADTDKNGILDKVFNGKKVQFKFTLINSNTTYDKYFTMYREELKKSGIDMSLKRVDFTTLIKIMDDKKFDAVSLGWAGGGVDNDPKQIWHSSSSKAGGSNYISYSNPEVDKLIDKGRAELNKKKRIKIYKKIYEKIANDAPYIFMFNKEYEIYGHSDKVEKLKPTYQFDVGVGYWWQKK